MHAKHVLEEDYECSYKQENSDGDWVQISEVMWSVVMWSEVTWFMWSDFGFKWSELRWSSWDKSAMYSRVTLY